MSRIRSHGNQDTEIRLITLMKQSGIHGWRRKYTLKGHPDFVFRKETVAVFVDGCFWHCCPKCGTLPKSNKKFWSDKLGKNKLRDKKVTHELRNAGWIVVRIWEHELRKDSASVIKKLLESLER